MRSDPNASPVQVAGTVDAVVPDIKLQHLARDPRAVLMIFETVAPFRGVKVRADVELEDPQVEDVRLSISSRSPRAGDGARLRRGERCEGVVLRLSASAARVWDLSGILPVTTKSDGWA